MAKLSLTKIITPNLTGYKNQDKLNYIKLIVAKFNYVKIIMTKLN
jgi:hypothetical protein